MSTCNDDLIDSQAAEIARLRAELAEAHGQLNRIAGIPFAKPINESALREAITPTSIDPDATLDAIRHLWPKPVLPSDETLKSIVIASFGDTENDCATNRQVCVDYLRDALRAHCKGDCDG